EGEEGDLDVVRVERGAEEHGLLGAVDALVLALDARHALPRALREEVARDEARAVGAVDEDGRRAEERAEAEGRRGDGDGHPLAPERRRNLPRDEADERGHDGLLVPR